MRFRLLLLMLVGVCTSSISLAESAGIDAQAAQVSDMRVIIDISGSMKKNDPQNLRVPALRLLTELVPEGQNAGVWTFGQYVNMLVKQGPVDKAWKEKAYQAANDISSRGMYTNIEGVLEKSTWDWKRPDDKANRSIIFLTDGVVDISKNAQENKESRQRILNDTMARLKGAGVKIHTIALSDDADKPFLRQLSSGTGGWFETVKDASQLERIFFKMFEKSVPVETLPLTDNKVLVDDSIRELTLLIFRAKGAGSSSLIQPDGKAIDHTNPPENVRWRHEERYDLVTVTKPMAGEWKVSAKLDPDNRVMVVTDLKVRASRIPNIVLSGDAFPYYVELHEEGEVITKPEFLDFVHVGLKQSVDGKELGSFSLNDRGNEVDKQQGDGRYSAKVGGEMAAGIYEYEMQVDGTTFKRAKRYSMRVVEKPVAVTVKEEQEGDPASYSLTLTPFAELLNLDTLAIDATLTKQGGASKAVTIPRTGPGEWRLDPKVSAGDIFEVAVAIEAERRDGRSVNYDLGSFQLGSGSVDVAFDQSEEHHSEAPQQEEEQQEEAPQPSIVPDLSKAVMSAPEPEPAPEPAVENVDEQALEHEEASEEQADEEQADEEQGEEEKPDWIMVTLKVVLLNGVLIGIGFFVYRKFFRAKKDDTEEDQAEAPTKDEAGKEEASKEEAESNDKD